MSFDPILPFFLTNHTAVDLRNIREKYNFRRFFILFCPTTPHFELPDIREYEDFGRRVITLKEELKDLELNWWCAPTLGYGKKTTYQRIVNYNGNADDTSVCPIDPAFRKQLSMNIAAAARIAHFPIIQFEDDYELSNHPGVTFGCFCPLHLAELEKRSGRRYTREELVQIYKENKRETMPLRREFDQVRRDSLLLLAADIRQELDRVSPETRISVCEPGTTDQDGDLVMKVPAVFAGEKHRPLVRVYGSNYCCRDSPQEMPWMLAHAMFSAERLPWEWELMHESDTFPHTRYFMSDTHLRSLMANAFSIGLSNSLFYACQYLDDPAEDRAYLAMGNKSRPFFNGILACSQDGHLDGVRILHTPESTSMPRLTTTGGSILGDTAWIFARLGFPYSTRFGSPVVLTGAEASVLSDEEIVSLLEGPLLLDALAAEDLHKRGFSELTGVHIGELSEYNFSYEILEDIPEFSGIKGRKIYNFASCPVATEASQYRNLIPLPGTETLSYLTNRAGQRLQPGICRFVNRLGGRVGVLCCSLKDNISSNILCYRKKQMMKVLLEWLRQEPLPACVVEEPNVWVLARKTENGIILTVTSLTLSHLENVKISFAPEYQGSLEELGEDGIWRKAPVKFADAMIILPELQTHRPRVFRIAKDKI